MLTGMSVMWSTNVEIYTKWTEFLRFTAINSQCHCQIKTSESSSEPVFSGFDAYFIFKIPFLQMFNQNFRAHMYVCLSVWLNVAAFKTNIHPDKLNHQRFRLILLHSFGWWLNKCWIIFFGGKMYMNRFQVHM